MMTFAEFGTFLEESVATVEPRLEVGLHALERLVTPLASSYIGHELPEWAPLSPATLEGFHHPLAGWIPGKIELGYTGHVSSSDPGLRTGEMRDSIKGEVEHLALVVGSPEKKMLWFEMGHRGTAFTGPQPPRPVLALAMRNSLEHAADVFGEVAMGLVSPSRGGRAP